MSVKDQVNKAGDKARETADKAKAKASEAATNVKQGAERAYEETRTRAIKAYDGARGGARKGARKTNEGIENNPFLALSGGLALGLIIGALIPRSRREKELLRDVGRDINTRAHGAFDAAKSAGQAQLEERGLTPSAAENVVRDVARGVGAAAKQSASAAADAAKQKQ